jgi:hypothetical protein
MSAETLVRALDPKATKTATGRLQCRGLEP